MPCHSILLIIGSLCAFAAHADLNSAADDRAKGHYAAAVAEYQRLAEAGDPVAQVNLGYMYYMGEGVARNYGQALAWYTEAADQGNADAQYNLAVAYAFGEGTRQDLATAVKWYQAAADQGHAVAQYSLGLSFANGEGVPTDPAQAIFWYTKSAEQGYIPARIMLGSKYYTGDDVALDYEAAFRWYRLAAEQGDAVAQYNLAGLYRLGQGVEQNETEARAWYTKSAEQGYSAATDALAAIDQTSTAETINTATASVNETATAAVSETVAPAGSAEAVQARPVADSQASTPVSTTKLVERQLARFDQSAAGAPSLPAATATGLMTMNDIAPTLPADASSAATRLLNTRTERVAALANKVTASARTDTDNEPPSSTSVDDIVGDDTADPSGTDAAKEQTANTVDHRPADPAPGREAIVSRVSPDIMAGTYEKGLSELKNKNFGVAHDLFSSAAANGYAPAQYQLALLYQRGLGTGQDKEAAASWYRRAAEQGIAEAQFTLANMYLMGEGIIQNDAQARYWYERAAAQGHAEASHNLQNLSRLNPVSLEQAGILSVTEQSGVTEAPSVKTVSANPAPPAISPRGSRPPETMVVSLSPAAEVTTSSNTSLDYERGLAYAFGTDIPKDLKSAFTYFRKAAENNHVQAQYKLAVAYAYGEGTGKDMAQAAYWYEKAAMRGHPIAQRNLGLMYLNGDGGVTDKPLALAWFGILADRGNVVDIQRMESLRKELPPEAIAQAEQLKQKLTGAMTKQTITDDEQSTATPGK